VFKGKSSHLKHTAGDPPSYSQRTFNRFPYILMASGHTKHWQKHTLLLKRSTGQASILRWHKKKAEGTQHDHWHSP